MQEPMLTVAALSAFVVGVVSGTGHCTAMCGGLLLAMKRANRRRTWALHLGRITTYAWLALALALGQQWVAWRQWLVARRAVLGLLGVALMVIGAEILLRRRFRPGFVDHATRAIGQGIRAVGDRGTAGAWLAGVLWGMIPCGFSWAAILGAATRSPLEALIVIVAFGLGTVAPLTGLAWIDERLSARQRLRWTRAVAVLLVAYGAWMSVRALRGAPLHNHSLAPTTSAPEMPHRHH